MKERELDEEADMNLPTRTAKSESRFTKNKSKDIDELEKEEARDRAEKVADLGRHQTPLGPDHSGENRFPIILYALLETLTNSADPDQRL